MPENVNNNKEYSNKVWWCWLQGEENAPELNKACLASLRENLIDREVIVITEENLFKYIDFPEYITKKYKKGIISRTHFSDLIRIELLTKYGGTWIDSSVYCTEYNRIFFDKPLFVFQNWKRNNPSVISSSWFITAEKDNPILKATKQLLYEYWKKNSFFIDYFLFHFFFTMATEKYKKLWEEIPRYSNIPPHILQFELLSEFSEERFEEIKKMSSFHKLNQKQDFSIAKENSYYRYIINNMKERNK